MPHPSSTGSGWKDWTKDETEKIISNGYKTLPIEMRRYLRFISSNVGVPIGIVSLGPKREETIYLRNMKWEN
jgi:adenylosuccinate synthase